MDALSQALLALMLSASISTGAAAPGAPAAASDPALIFQQQLAQKGIQPSPTPQAAAAPSPTRAVITLSTQPPAAPAPTSAPTPAPTQKAAAPSGGSSTSGRSSRPSMGRELSKGMQGDDVRMLQQLLRDLGYDVQVDGSFGDKTREAVRAFQEKNGLKADGIAGSRTIRRLTGGDAVGAGDAAPSRAALSYGMSGPDVMALQSRLLTLGYYAEEVTGNYLAKTKDAVERFQRANGLAVDGIAGSSTLSLLHGSSALAASATTATPVPTQMPPAAGVFFRTLKEDMSGSDVSHLQQLLKGLGYFTETVTGYFGPATRQAVADFQFANGLTADGVAGSVTQEALTAPGVIPRTAGSAGGWVPRTAADEAARAQGNVTGAALTVPQAGQTCAFCGRVVYDAATHARPCMRCNIPACAAPDACPGTDAGSQDRRCVYP